MRPEFVRNFHKPISPDVFLYWGSFDSNKLENEAEAIDASRSLREVTIPKFASYLNKDQNNRAFHNELFNELIQELHTFGNIS